MFSTFEIIKDLCRQRKISIAKVESDLGYSRNTLYKMKTQTPSAERIKELADYFQVSADYLLSREVDTQPTYAQFFRVDVSDLTDSEKEEFEQEMQAMSDFIAERIRIRKAQKKIKSPHFLFF